MIILNQNYILFEKLLKKNANIITDVEISQYRSIKKIANENKYNIETISNKDSNLELISHEYHDEKQIIKIKYNKNIYKFQTSWIGKIQIKNILMAMIAATKNNKY